MELRKENESPEIKLRAANIRRSSSAIRGGRMAAGKTDKGAVRASGAAKNAAKYAMLDKTQKKALAYLSAEQMKQWKSYRWADQKKIMEAAQRSVGRMERLHTPQHRTAYTRAEDIPAKGTVFYSHETGKRADLQKAKREKIRGEYMRLTRPPTIIKAKIKGNQWNPQALRAQFRAAIKARKKEGADHLGFVLRREIHAAAAGHRHTIKGVKASNTYFYEADSGRAVYKANRVMREQRKEARRKEKKEKVFWRTVTTLIDRDIKKQEQMKKARTQEQIEVMEYEREIWRQVSGTVFFLPRAHAAALQQKAIVAVKSMAAGFLKAAAPILLPLGFVIILVVLIGGFLSGLSVEQQGYSATGYEIVEYAKQWIGVTKYVWGAGRGGGNDWQDYADCSSFVQGVFAHFGYQLGSTTYEMQNNGELVGGLDDAVPGDIILFYTGGSPSHVAIYAGEGRMIHCAGGPQNYSPQTAGTGVCWGDPYADGRPFKVRRIVHDVVYGEGGHKTDNTAYTQSQLELIWAIVAQEDNGSYEGALAVISSAMNRTESPSWAYCGSNALSQLTAPGQYCYSIDNYWRARLGGNVPSYVKQAVNDCLKGGVRNHKYTCFRSTKGSQTGADAVQIGGNWFFGN